MDHSPQAVWMSLALMLVLTTGEPPIAQAKSPSKVDEKTSRPTEAIKPVDEAKTYFFPIPTLGADPSWADVQVGLGAQEGYRIQYNVWFRGYRLIDGRQQCVAWGTLAQCQAFLEKLVPLPKDEAGKDKEDARPLVLILHGLGQTRHAMIPLALYLQSRGFDAKTINYPSTLEKIESHADRLAHLIDRFPKGTKVHLIGHSMGGLVIRSYMARHGAKRVKDVIFLGTPNRGSQRADVWMNNWLYRLIMGPAGQQLGQGPKGIAGQLPIKLEVPFGIVAGGNPRRNGFSKLIKGDNDGTVAVANTLLPGAQDYLLLRVSHAWLADHPAVCLHVSNFLIYQQFRPRIKARLAPAAVSSAKKQ